MRSPRRRRRSSPDGRGIRAARRRGAPLHAGERLARVEPELRVERERAVVEGGLHEPHAREVARRRALEHPAHQAAADAAVLRVGVDRDGADAGDRRALVEHVAADDAAVVLGHDAVESRMREAQGEEGDGDVGVREVRREAVLRVDPGEGSVTDPAAGLGVGRRRRAEHWAHAAAFAPKRCACISARLARSWTSRAKFGIWTTGIPRGMPAPNCSIRSDSPRASVW